MTEGKMPVMQERIVSWRPIAILAALALAVACTPSPQAETNAFLLRSRKADLQTASGLVLQALLSALRAEGMLEAPYPLVGHLTTEPDPSDAGVELMRCTPGQPDDLGQETCILLSQPGDFIRVMPITWPSEAFYSYRIYVSSRLRFARVDPVKDFVAIDVYLLHEPGLSETIDQGIRRAVEELGARPFRP